MSSSTAERVAKLRGCRFTRHFVRIVLVVLAMALQSSVAPTAEDCEPKRNCDATRDCTLQVDTRSCGRDFLGVHYNDPVCEAAKAAQNAGYKVAKDYCEVQKSLEKFDCERVKTQQRVGCELGIDGPFSCSAGEVLSQLRTAHQDGLTDFAELAGAITTPLKKIAGQLGWRDTACIANGTGVPYRNSQRSTDGYCTVDVRLASFVIEGNQRPPGERFLRLEMPPGGKASAICANRTISTLDVIQFGGPVRIDRHFPGERWLEVHVTDDFDFVDNASQGGVVAGRASPPATAALIATYSVKRGDCLARIAQRFYGKQLWAVIYKANRSSIRNPDVIFPAQILILPPLEVGR